MNDISIPEVASLTQRAEFFKKDGRDMVKIFFVGSKDTIINKVTPEHMSRFKRDWDTYSDGQPMVRRPGTALTDAVGVDQSRADNYIARNIHNLEELAALSDGQCQSLGMGTLTDRKAAQQLLTTRKMQDDTQRRDAIGKAASSITSAPVATPEIAEMKAEIRALTENVAALVGLMSAQAAKKKPGRPPKEGADK